MKFSVATNWQQELLSSINRQSVEEIFGKLNHDFIGGGKPSFLLPFVNRRNASNHIRKAHSLGIEFNYLLNGVCLDNLEFTRKGQRQLRNLLDWLESINVDSLTVSIPYIFQIIRKRYPRFKLYVSTYAGVDSVQKALYWEDLGASKITLSQRTARNIPLLKKIRQNLRCRLQLIANIACLYDCPLLFYHRNILSHASQTNHRSGGFLIDYCILKCFYRKMSDPSELIRALWIRPEDIRYYEDIGIDSLKLLDRFRTTGSMAAVVKAYVGHRYDGDLKDLLFECGRNNRRPGNFLEYARRLLFFFRPFYANIFKLRQLSGIFSSVPLSINNRKLDGFFEYFLKDDCGLKSCTECGYCQVAAKKAVTIDDKSQKEVLKRVKLVLDELISGKIFRYF
jgi:collagenase-like PrtC family protease